MGSQNWEVRQGRKISADGSWATAYVAHILDDSGQSARNRWFGTREEAERWAQDTVSIGKALETAATPSAGVPQIGDARLRQIIDLGGLCNAGEVLAMAAELLTVRAERASQPATPPPGAQPFRIGWP